MDWLPVLVTLCLAGLVYFLIKGIRIAMSNKEPPSLPEGDYIVTVVGKTKRGDFIAWMRPRGSNDKTT